MEENELLSLIDKYFQGLTSLEEEKVLRRSLRDTASEHPTVMEAKAVLAYIAMASSHNELSSKGIVTHRDTRINRSSKGSQSFRIEGGIGRKMKWGRWSVAAAVVILVGSVMLPMLLRQDDSVCSTMIACRMDNSQETAFNLISSQLEAVGFASDEVAEEVLDGLVLMSEY